MKRFDGYSVIVAVGLGVCAGAGAITPTPTPAPGQPYIAVSANDTLVCDETRTLVIIHTGDYDSTLVVDEIELWHGYSQGYYGFDFTWDLSGIVLPASLQRGERIEIPIAYTAADDFPSRLHLRVDSNAVNEPVAMRIYIGELCDTPTVTPTPTYTPTPIGLTLNGYVAEFPPCMGAMRGVTVRLEPDGRTTQTSLTDGGFTFSHLTPGVYTLSISPPCNPFGCWPEMHVELFSSPTTVYVCPVANDVDRDGIADSAEVGNQTPSTQQGNRVVSDSDVDGLLDGVEDADGSGTREAGETSVRNWDSDGDRIGDGVEVFIGSHPLTAESFVDSDGDRLPDAHDIEPGIRDIDGDRYDDGFEAAVFQSALATFDAAIHPPHGDANGNGMLDNLDALVLQSYFLGLIDHNAPVYDGAVHTDAYRYMELNGDGMVSNVDSFIAQALFLGVIDTLPVR